MEVPPVTAPEMSYSVCPFVHTPWPWFVKVSETAEVWPLLDQVKNVPVGSRTALTLPVDAGEHLETVMEPPTVPVTFEQAIG